MEYCNLMSFKLTSFYRMWFINGSEESFFFLFNYNTSLFSIMFDN